MTLRTDEELDRALDDLAKAEGLSKQEVIKRAVIERRDRTLRRAKLDRIASEVLVEYAEALERLGKA